MTNTDFYLNNYRYFITNDIGVILIGFDKVSECRDYIQELVNRDSEELGAENADPAFYHIYFNKAGSLGKKVV